MSFTLKIKNNFNTYEEKQLTFKRSNDLYSLGLSFLSEALGNLHNVSSHQRYWEIVIGIWLRESSVLYLDRSKLIDNLEIDELNNLKQYFKQIYFIPKNYREFTTSLNTESALSVVLFSRKNLNEGDLSYLPNTSVSTDNHDEESKESFLRKIFNSFYRFLIFLNINNHNFITIEGLSALDKLKIYFRTMGKTLPYMTTSTHKVSQELDKTGLRKKLLEDIINNNQLVNKEFLIFLIKSLPLSYLEDFEELKNKKLHERRFFPDKIFLDSRFRMEDDFKILLAEWCSLGTKTFVLQHSLNCLVDFDSSFQNDLTFDNYIYWDNLNDKEQKCPSIRLNKFVKEYKIKFKNQIKFDPAQRLKSIENDLYVCRTFPDAQGGSLAVTTKDSQSIKEGRLELSKSVANFKKSIVVRIRPGDSFGEDNVKSVFDSSSALRFSESNQSIQDLYHNSRIIIFEGLSMGVSECLALNRPFLILNYNSYMDIRRSRLKNLFLDLKNLNIIQSNIEDLSFMLSEGYIEDFYSSQFQKHLKSICNTYFPISENYLDHWMDNFKGKNA